ncbi:hypothetical protein J1N35_041783 [Gossypium stocksii]|uniref:Uncharacterized protein n=1 Tax=Gossypium stocksii TaxID=47602 RepID=A0A9D3UGG5_9ROSI|nr:hypothetical protein J1N35_041783 [Gossypium stocksii]
MHHMYDEEIDSGEDPPVLIVNPLNKKALRISSDVIRVYQALKRKKLLWKSGQKIKVLKGAYAGCYKNNVYATIEYFLIEGFEGDSGAAGISLLFTVPRLFRAIKGGDGAPDIWETVGNAGINIGGKL